MSFACRISFIVSIVINTGPNGEKLSVVYNTAINNFIPKLDYLVPFIRDRAGLGNFLEEPSGEVDVKTGKSLSRIELCKQLYVTYPEAKNDWNEKKTRHMSPSEMRTDKLRLIMKLQEIGMLLLHSLLLLSELQTTKQIGWMNMPSGKVLKGWWGKKS